MEILVITGPTASGKSALALNEAARLGGEIVSVDSMQLYKGIEIGTAQPTLEERARVPHHLVGIWDFSVRAEVFTFCELAENAIADIRRRGKIPVVAGGTGFYLKALFGGLDDLPADRQLRKELDEKYDSDAGEVLLAAEMLRLDPAAYEKWKLCRRRLIRALEVRLITGQSILTLQSGKNTTLRYDAEVFRLDPDADALKQRINARAAKMLDNGWIEEAENAIAHGLFTSPTAHQALGYKQIAAYLNGEFDRETLLTKICTATWQYARRQRTWFRHQHPEAQTVTP